jgi:hypothetical protein
MAQSIRETRYLGIQKWLRLKGYCMDNGQIDNQKYRKLIVEFVFTTNAKFDVTKAKGGFSSLENFVSNRFGKFCDFCNRKYNPRKK